MIILNKERDYIAEGMYQICYKHPENKDVCIKISKPNAIIQRVEKELKYYKQLNRRRGLKHKDLFYAKYLNTVATNLGPGFSFDFIIDEVSGEVSNTLEYYLLHPDPELSIEILQKEYENLIDTLITHKVMAVDLWARNICCQLMNDGTVNLIIIDGLGHRDFFPLVDWFSYFTKKKLYRRMRKNHMSTLKDQLIYLLAKKEENS